MGLRLSPASFRPNTGDGPGSLLKFYTINGSGGSNIVYFPVGTILERITLTDKGGSAGGDVVIKIKKSIFVSFPLPAHYDITYYEISRLNVAVDGYAIDQIDFFMSIFYASTLLAVGEYVMVEIENLPVDAVLSFRYYHHPNTY